MVILGAGGHAKEVLEVLMESILLEDIALFDNVTSLEEIPEIFAEFKIIQSEEQLKTWFETKNDEFVIGVGGIKEKQLLWNMGVNCGGKPYSVKAKNASIATYDTSIGDGACIMQMAFISNSVYIGKAALINTRANIHHDVSIGDFCDISPSAVILGRVEIGSNVSIGAGAVVLPKVVIGNHCTIGAGAVVTKDLPDNAKVKGNPAR